MKIQSFNFFRDIFIQAVWSERQFFCVEIAKMQFIIPLKRDDLLEPADQANAYVVENLLDANEVDELKLQGL